MEYISELFEDNRKDYNIMEHNFVRPPIMKNEIWAAIRKMKLCKALGPDSILVRLLEAFEGYEIGKIATLLSKTFDTVRFHQASSNLYL